MLSLRRLLPVLLLTVLVPVLGQLPANAVGTGVPVIVTPVDGADYHVDEVPDLHLDFSDAPYGDYRVELTDTPDNVLFGADIEHTEAVDPDAFYELPALGVAEYTVTVTGAGEAVLVTATFGTYDLGEPPRLCSVNLPERVTAVSPATSVYPTYDGCGDASVTWYMTGRGAYADTPIGLDHGVSTGRWLWRDSDPVGRYEAVPQDIGPDGLNLGSAETVVKFGSRISLAAGTRTATRVPLTGVVSRYSPAANAFRRWADRPIAISYKDCVSCPWTFLAMDRTDRYGAYGLTVISTKARYYRATVGETATAWGRTSQPVRR